MNTRHFRTIRCLILTTIMAGFAGIVFSGELVDDARAAASEEELLAVAGRIDAAGIDPARDARTADAEEARLLIAERLATEGTESSLPWLEETARRKPTVLVERMGCRHPYMDSLHPFDLAAGQAIRQIKRQSWASVYTETWPQSRALPPELAAMDMNSPQVAGALDAIPTLEPATALTLAEELASGTEGPLNQTASLLFAALSIHANRAPDQETFLRLSGVGGLFLLQQSDRFTREERQEFLAIARRDSRFASMAVLMDEELPRTFSTREYLRRNGVHAASVLGRNKSPELTDELEAILADPAVVDRADQVPPILALLKQDTPEARSALRHVAAMEHIAIDLREDTERMLDR